MWPYLKDEIKKTFISDAHFEYIKQRGGLHHQTALFAYHEIGYRSLTLPKRIFLGNAVDTNPYHLFFYMLARFYFFDDGKNEIVYHYGNTIKPYLVESALKYLPKRFKRETVKQEGYEYIEMPGCGWRATGIEEPWTYSYVRDLYRELWISTGQEKGKYTFISRNKKDIPNRRILNEDDLLTPLKELGFSCYNLNDLTFEQQIKLFRSSEIITGYHGAGLAWLIFCLPGTKVLEIKNPYLGVIQDYYKDISNKCELSYQSFESVQIPTKEQFPGVEITSEDCVIDKESYLSTLKSFIESN